MEITELIASQIKTVLVMAGAGVAVSLLWSMMKLAGCRIKKKTAKVLIEISFWVISAVTVSMFLYYCAYGRITVHAAAGFLAGLLLYKKTCYGIIKQVWVEKEEAENSKTTAGSSISKMPENKGWKKGRQSERKKKRE